jgi:hypothetical protein
MNIHVVIFLSKYSSDSKISVNISSRDEQNVSSDEEENVSDNSSMQHGTRAKSGAGQPRFLFNGKTGINVDL